MKATAIILATITLLAYLTAGAAMAMPPANYNDVKTCCHIDGRCVVVERWRMCPAGFY